ncbi:thioredoxin family protein [Streptomyces mirabilis]|uniref:thioredoxin family protein n=1 Tax=Streptomyces mirabilis TaxID=68239 RepID=UPI003324B482
MSDSHPTTAGPRLHPVNHHTAASVVERSHTEPVVLYFTATWCGPCKIFGPVLAEFTEIRPDISFGEVDDDHRPHELDHFPVRAYPSLFVMRNGRPVWSSLGGQDLDQLADLLGPAVRDAAALPDEPYVAPTGSQAPSMAVELPTWDDPRVQVAMGRELCNPGDTVVIDRGTQCRLRLAADLRRSPSLDLSVVHAFPARLPVRVLVYGPDLEAGRLTALAHFDTIKELTVLSTAPLALAVIDDIVTLTRNRQIPVITVEAPGIDIATLREVLPATTVNGFLPGQSVPTAQAPTVDELTRITVSDLRELTRSDPAPRVIVYDNEHPATTAHDNPRQFAYSTAFAAFARAHPEIRTAAVTTYGVPDRLLPLGGMPGYGMPALAIVVGEQVVWCHPAPITGDEDLEALIAPVLARVEATASNESLVGLSPVELTPPSVLDTTQFAPETSVMLLPPGRPERDAVHISAGEADIEVPGGWEVMVTARGPVPWPPLDVARHLIVSPSPGAGTDALAGLSSLRNLHTLMVSNADDLSEIAEMTWLRAVTVIPSPGETAEAKLRQALPNTIVNGRWTSPSLTVDSAVTGSG